MPDQACAAGLNRRQALRLGAMASATGLVAAGSLLSETGTAVAAPAAPTAAWHGVVAEIERIIRVKGMVSNGVLGLEVDRDDIPHVHKEGVPVKPAFEINGNLYFQSMGGDQVMMNGDLCFKPEELNPAIDQMVKHGMTWQAMHQHLWGLHPMVWFMHMRMRGSARTVARACHAVISVTSTPLPQAPPKHPTTPLDAKRLGEVIGQTPTVGASGVVTIDVPRRNRITLGGVRISPFLNITTPVAFQPLGRARAVVVPDFGMTAQEVMPCLIIWSQAEHAVRHHALDPDDALDLGHHAVPGGRGRRGRGQRRSRLRP